MHECLLPAARSSANKTASCTLTALVPSNVVQEQVILSDTETKLACAETLPPTSSTKQLYLHHDTYAASTTLMWTPKQPKHHIGSPMPELQSPLMADLKGRFERQASSYQISCCLSTQGHAGTVPMAIRRDPLAAAAEAINTIEQQCGGGQLEDIMQSMPNGKQAAQSVWDPSLVCTVGAISVWPGASNVIAGSTNFSVDIRQANGLPRNPQGTQSSSAYQYTCFQSSNTSWFSLLVARCDCMLVKSCVIYLSQRPPDV